MAEHEDYMREALRLADKASSLGETPVGCVIVSADGAVIGRGYNRTESRDATCHAEIEAIRDASRAVGAWRLSGCAMYVTMEPCPMCAGAVMNSRLSRLYYGAKDERMGSCGSVINLFMENYGSSTAVVGGIMEDECGEKLTGFYRRLRKKEQN